MRATLWAMVILAAAAPTAATTVDDFDDLSGWEALPADGVKLAITSDPGAQGDAMRLDFDFLTGSGWAVARKQVDLQLPENYVFTLRVRGQCLPNHFEFKLVDSTGANVWWSVRRDVQFPDAWETWRIKKRHIQFAWGPRGGGDITHVAAIEIAITAGSGGAGRVWIDDLELHALPSVNTAPPPPRASASSARPGHDAQRALDGNMHTSWWCAEDDAAPDFRLDFTALREYGGVVLDWEPEKHPTDYEIQVSDDGTGWQTVSEIHGANGGRDYIYMPESESRFLRLRVLRAASAAGVALREAAVQKLEWSATRESFFQAVARDAPRGVYPRGMSDEQAYWTVVGVDGDTRDALLGEDGALEAGPGGFSIEPFLFVEGKLWTWNEADITQELEEGFLPVPTVHWTLADLELDVTAFAVGPAESSAVVVRYRVRNPGPKARHVTLFLAARPFQVNPPSQTLNTVGGTAPIRDMTGRNHVLFVNRERAVVALQRPDDFGAVAFDAGDVVADYLRRGQLPDSSTAQDPFAAASGAWAFVLDLAPEGEAEVDILVPLHPVSRIPDTDDPAASGRWLEREFEKTRTMWRERLGRVEIRVPDEAAHVVQSLRSQVAYILINRAGPALQPGTRSYARSWIRDGSLTSSALLRLGHTGPVREYLEWYARHQFPNGKIPCVVDARGPDPVPEHDSSGEFIFLVAELYRHTHDHEMATRLWPRVVRAVAYLDSLRQERRTAAYQKPDKRMYFGILPPSISHEGYSAAPMHSYWDDFFALRGFSDAVFLAEVVDEQRPRERMAELRDTFAHDLRQSIEHSMKHHGIDYIPGCADLGDFDPTSTTIALAPLGMQDQLPGDALRRTFERYNDFARARRAGADWEAFTPYEVRNIGAFVRLGWRQRAHELLDNFLAYQRPIGWRQWPEVVRRDARQAAFLGDLPHTWVGSDFVRSVLDLFAYERQEDDALVLAAGVPDAWLHGSGVEVRGIRTYFGSLSYSLRPDENGITVRIEAGLRMPRGGIVVSLPNDQAVVHELPATLRLRR